MARKHRIQYEGAVYHVMNRGDRREPIFYADADRQRPFNHSSFLSSRPGSEVVTLNLSNLLRRRPGQAPGPTGAAIFN